jgi:hypothetical protein
MAYKDFFYSCKVPFSKLLSCAASKGSSTITAQSLSFPILSITCYVHISFKTSFFKKEKGLSRFCRTTASRRSLLNNYGIIHDKTLDCRNVRIPIKKIRIILCLTVKRNKSDSFPANPTAAQATAID